MNSYYVNNRAQSNGDHEVHTSNCMYLPSDKTYLGMYSNCGQAIIAAKEHYAQVDGCAYCCSACHKS